MVLAPHFPPLTKANTMLQHFPPRQAPANPNRRAGKVRSFRALCEARRYSQPLTQALLETAVRRYANGQPVAWPQPC